MQIKELAQQVVNDAVLNHYAMTEAFLQDLVNPSVSKETILWKYNQSTLEVFMICVNELTAKKSPIDRKVLLSKYLRMMRMLKCAR